MKLPQLIPPPDLLNKIDGVEEGLRKRRRLGVLGFVGALASLTQILYSSRWLHGLATTRWQVVLHDWLTLLAVLGFALGVLLFTWAKFWLRESRRPFRYTYYVGEFRPVDEQSKEPCMAHLPFDLSERLSTRIMRLSRFDERTASDEAKARRKSHVHVEGDYLIRRDSQNSDRWVLEVLPWVRVGPPGNRETLAFSVTFALDQTKVPFGNHRSSTGPSQSEASGIAEPDEVADGAAPPVLTPGDGPPALTSGQYGLLVERVYYSIATQVYKQIRADVRGKIDLLPTRYLRATAYYNEAWDYARSNTLDAYEAAKALYDDAVATYDPYWSPAPQGAARRALLAGRKLIFQVARDLRRTISRIFPALGRVDVMMARAMIGYADMILYRHVLAGMAGLTTSPIFEARPVAQQAVADLHRVKRDVPGRRDALFDAYVTLATAYFYLGSTGDEEDRTDGGGDSGPADWSKDAASCLAEALRLGPARTERDPKYLFIRGKLQPRIQWELRLLRRAVELDPKFEIAQFELALRSELQWRGRPSLERGSAELVAREYREVLAINPGNISTLGRLGDLYWLLAPPAGTRPSRRMPDYRGQSKAQFLRGRDYKAARQETFVAELEYGLARLAAEAGRFQEAYDLYSSAVSAHVAQGVAHGRDGYTTQFHFFDQINDNILERYRQYAKRVADLAATAEAREGGACDKRIRDAVQSYALHDYGEACFRSWLRYGGDSELSTARDNFERAWELSGKELVFSAYNLFLMEMRAGRLEAAIEWVNRVQQVERLWPDGRLAQRFAYGAWAQRAWIQVDLYESRLQRKNEELEDLERSRDGWYRPLQADPGLASRAAPGDQTSTFDIPVPTLPLPPSSQSDMAIRRVDERINALKAKIRELQEKLEQQRCDLRKAEAKAGQSAQSDVPHNWLAWLWDDSPSIRRLKQADRDGARQRRRWERELDDVHVRVLINWALMRWLLAENMLAESSSTKDPNAANMQAISRLLLKRLHRHFWPDDLDLLEALRSMGPPEHPRGVEQDYYRRIGTMILRKREDFEPDYNQRIRAIVLRRSKQDPQYFLAGWAMSDQAFSPEDKLRILKPLSALKLSPNAWSKLLIQVLDGLADVDQATRTLNQLDQKFQLEPEVWYEIGRSLVATDQLVAGRAAFRRAVERGQDSDLLGRLGDELAGVGDWEQSALAFKKGMEAFENGGRRALPA